MCCTRVAGTCRTQVHAIVGAGCMHAYEPTQHSPASSGRFVPHVKLIVGRVGRIGRAHDTVQFADVFDEAGEC